MRRYFSGLVLMGFSGRGQTNGRILSDDPHRRAKGSAIPGGERRAGAVECRALGRGGWLSRWRRCGGPRPGRREYVHVGFSATSVGVLRRSGGERKGPRVAPRPFRNGVWPDDQARPACFITSAA